mmetsp:Transcript_13466/g.21037  ORF Transcript_13466/g.21037 Transcript_13466/m.21037 type:complete len:81 (-) Transcript_13466:3975-4217(-)
MPSVKEENFKWGSNHLIAVTQLINNPVFTCQCAPDRDNGMLGDGNDKKGLMDSGLHIIQEEGDEDKRDLEHQEDGSFKLA